MSVCGSVPLKPSSAQYDPCLPPVSVCEEREREIDEDCEEEKSQGSSQLQSKRNNKPLITKRNVVDRRIDIFRHSQGVN